MLNLVLPLLRRSVVVVEPIVMFELTFRGPAEANPSTRARPIAARAREIFLGHGSFPPVAWRISRGLVRQLTLAEFAFAARPAPTDRRRTGSSADRHSDAFDQ